jgi:hypothetical protein
MAGSTWISEFFSVYFWLSQAEYRTYLLANLLPDDPGHLIPIKFDDRVLYGYLGDHVYEFGQQGSDAGFDGRFAERVQNYRGRRRDWLFTVGKRQDTDGKGKIVCARK